MEILMKILIIFLNIFYLVCGILSLVKAYRFFYSLSARNTDEGADAALKEFKYV